MKKLTSLFLAGMLATTSCFCAVGASAVDNKATINVTDKNSYDGTGTICEVNVGDKVEVVVTGYSDKAITSVLSSTYINQSDVNNLVEYSDIDILGYSDGYYGEGEDATYYTSDFNGYIARPESGDEFDRDLFGFCYILGQPAGNYSSEDGQVIYKFVLDVKEAGNCSLQTVVDDVTYDNEQGDIESSIDVLKTKTVLNVISSEETPTEVPTEEPTQENTEVSTEEPTQVPTEESTQENTSSTEVVTDAPTSATNATVDSTTATQASTSAPTSGSTATNNNSSSNTTSGNTNSSSTGKVATGDSTSVTLLVSALAVAMGVFVVARKKLTK